jgi:TM2 domain-containing membrane protein YozV
VAEDAVVEGRIARDTNLNPYAAALFSLLWPGVGQLYCGW